MPPKKTKPNPTNGAVAIDKIDRFGRQVYRNPAGSIFVKDGSRIVYVRKTFPKEKYTFNFENKPINRVDKLGRQVYRDGTGSLFVKEGTRITYVKNTFPKK
ncbi:PBCV-specific basic adaptor domain-containing protein [Only Syngen Nebraska virus 5]|jgi:hypothetical protein|uniref:PBCV-specific basic adaptor domain-containing protein n=1 Tax=Only Syngen Nebraska virus 5 TaxID=1917232 RepID=UPI000901BBB6|nr:PBCV-specific basic adaptor domain-containing protein [Only Syngen Nebraska virus 5]APC25589.1 PBCV-specific basic adaptor domain-containing protein [Only Syngen Nebraska virus 5]